MRLVFGVTLALCVVCGGVFAQERGAAEPLPKKVAVYMSGKNQTGAQSEIVAFALTDALSESRSFIATERTKDFLSTIAKEGLYQFSGAADNSQIAELGKKSGVNYVCAAELIHLSDIFKGSEEFLLAVRLISAEGAAIVGSAYRVAVLKTSADLLSASQGLAKELVGNFEKRDDATAQMEKAAIYLAGGVEDGVGRVLQLLLINTASKSDRYAVSERTGSFLEALSRDSKQRHSDAVDDRQLAKLGAQAGVKYVIAVRIASSEVINIRMIDAASGNIAKSASGMIDIYNTASIELSASELIAKFLGIDVPRTVAASKKNAPARQPADSAKTAAAKPTDEQPRQTQAPKEPSATAKKPRQAAAERGRKAVPAEQSADTGEQRQPLDSRRSSEPSAKFGAALSCGDDFVDDAYFVGVGVAYIRPIAKNISFAPQAKLLVGSYANKALSFSGVNLPLLAQFKIDPWRQVSLFAEGGVGVDWRIDTEKNTVFNYGLTAGAGAAFDIGIPAVYLDAIRVSYGTEYTSFAAGLRAMFNF
ncbi:MAG: hypothetical protein LBH93_02465 [Chitinispirillales bacterium]|jgi:hypothetical protein|nr:hypothetical protein [Chitinispirillales bacterium]